MQKKNIYSIHTSIFCHCPTGRTAEMVCGKWEFIGEEGRGSVGKWQRQNLCSKTDTICSFFQGIRHWKPHFPGYYFSFDQRSGKKGNKQFRHPSLLKFLLPHTAWLRDSKCPGLRTACPSSFDKGGCIQNTCKLTSPSLLSTYNK